MHNAIKTLGIHSNALKLQVISSPQHLLIKLDTREALMVTINSNTLIELTLQGKELRGM